LSRFPKALLPTPAAKVGVFARLPEGHKQSEKQSSSDRSNDLDDPQEQPTAKKRRGQQPGRPVPKRRDYSHLPPREEQIDVSRTIKSVPAVASR